jgi:hypothetical protein
MDLLYNSKGQENAVSTIEQANSKIGLQRPFAKKILISPLPPQIPDH